MSRDYASDSTDFLIRLLGSFICCETAARREIEAIRKVLVNRHSFKDLKEAVHRVSLI